MPTRSDDLEEKKAEEQIQAAMDAVAAAPTLEQARAIVAKCQPLVDIGGLEYFDRYFAAELKPPAKGENRMTAQRHPPPASRPRSTGTWVNALST